MRDLRFLLCCSAITATSLITLSTNSFAISVVGVEIYRTHDGDTKNRPVGFCTQDWGSSWVVSSLPGNKQEILHSVTCKSNGSYCVAVGSSLDKQSTNVPFGYFSTDGGLNWHASNMLTDKDFSYGSLHSVTCDTKGNKCIAIGSYTNGNNYFSYSYNSKDGGKNWNAQNLIGQSTEFQQTSLSGIFCDESNNHCIAVGSYRTPSERVSPIAYVSSDGGNIWNTIQLPLVDSKYSGLRSVACSSDASRCVAIGYNYDDAGKIRPLSYISTNGGNAWELSKLLPDPQELPALNSISCDSSGLKCVLVGANNSPIESNYIDDIGYDNQECFQPISYTSDDGGNTWMKSIIQIAKSFNCQILMSVMCKEESNQCMAIGDGSNNLGPTSPIIYISNNGGKSWAPSLAPLLSPESITSTIFSVG